MPKPKSKSKPKFKKGDTVYWIEDDEETTYSGNDDPYDWIVKGKVVLTYNAVRGKGFEPYPMYVVRKESPIDVYDTDSIGEDQLFADVSSIYDSVIKNLTEHIAVLRKNLEYIKERKRHSSDLQ